MGALHFKKPLVLPVDAIENSKAMSRHHPTPRVLIIICHSQIRALANAQETHNLLPDRCAQLSREVGNRGSKITDLRKCTGQCP
jgi:hypothetical protein